AAVPCATPRCRVVVCSCSCAMQQRGTEHGEEGPPTLSRFRPRDEYLSTFGMLQDDDRNEAYIKAIRLLASKLTGSHIDHGDDD
ncbi:unnamed protein product, partial [Laminaria digitata]